MAIHGPQGGDVPPELLLGLRESGVVEGHLELDHQIAQEGVDSPPHEDGPGPDRHIVFEVRYKPGRGVNVDLSEYLPNEG